MKIIGYPRFNWQTTLAAALWALASADVARSEPIVLEVDARDLPRSLLHARLEIPARPGKLTLWYPKWIPGIHAPGGPIQNMAGLRIATPEGKALSWRRDDEELYRVDCEIPAQTDRVIVSLDYICNQPSANSTGVDSYGTPFVGVINWNTCLLYPDGIRSDQLMVRVRLRQPEKWRFGTALKVEQEQDGVVSFQPASLETLVDSPLICGEHFRKIDLKAKDSPPTFLHLTSESPSAIQIDDDLIGKYRNLATEASALFGASHFLEYHFLVTCSDLLPRLGLEHHSCSLNGVGERELVDEKKRKGWAAYLLPHEFVHSWCGKYRRPATMCTPDFHTPQHTKLLWVYEGLTQYLGEVLTVRSGLLTFDEYLQLLAEKISRLNQQVGRRWRSLEDTAVASYQLRAPSKSWGNLRRGQDYYNEGLLLWLHADGLIRNKTDGQRSLDDFCRKFMGPPASPPKVAPHDRDEVIRLLRETADHDWEKFLGDWVDRPLESLPLEFVSDCGYRLQYANKLPAFLEERERDQKFIGAIDSLGLAFNEVGQIQVVVPERAGDTAGLAPGMTVQAVNGRKFSRDRLKDALADSVIQRKIEFLITEGDRFRTVQVDYADGARSLELVRDPAKPDRLKDILKSAPGEAAGN